MGVMRGLGLGGCARGLGLWLWGSGVRGAVWFRLLPSSCGLFGCFCSGRGCNSISIFLRHCLCVVLFTLMLLINCFYYEWLSSVCRFFV